MLIQIKAPHFVAGVETFRMSSGGAFGYEDEEYDNECAPIIKYMRYWSPYRIKKYCQSMGWGYNPNIEAEVDNIIRGGLR